MSICSICASIQYVGGRPCGLPRRRVHARRNGRHGETAKTPARTVGALLHAFARDASGAVLVETAIALPVLILMLVGMMQFGLIFMNYLRLTEATGAGARLMSVQRGLDTPWSDTIAEIRAAAPKPSANVSVAVSVNGTACGDDSACAELLRDAQGQPLRVQTSYTCNLTFLSALPQLCPLTSSMTGRVQ